MRCGAGGQQRVERCHRLLPNAARRSRTAGEAKARTTASRSAASTAAHGAGSEGHQSPYIALGDYTMLRRNMCFSEEPGLYDPENGYQDAYMQIWGVK